MTKPNKSSTSPNLELEKKKFMDAIYNELYKHSRVSDGVRVCNEDEWPLEELADMVLVVQNESMSETPTSSTKDKEKKTKLIKSWGRLEPWEYGANVNKSTKFVGISKEDVNKPSHKTNWEDIFDTFKDTTIDGASHWQKKDFVRDLLKSQKTELINDLERWVMKHYLNLDPDDLLKLLKSL